MEIRAKRINNIKVKPFLVQDEDDDKPTRAKDLFDVDYHNTYLCAKKKSGKSTVVSQIVRQTVGPETKIHIFSSTVNSDRTYRQLKKWCKMKRIYWEANTSIKDDNGIDLINEIMEEDRNYIQDTDDEEEEKPLDHIQLDQKQEKIKRKRKSKYKEIRRIFIFDDLSNEIRNSQSLKKLVKEHRHYKSVILISSQYTKDVPPQVLAQLDYCLLFKNHSDDKLEDLYKTLDLSVDFDKFLNIYKKVTQTKDGYNFLYIDRANDTFRMNFDLL